MLGVEGEDVAGLADIAECGDDFPDVGDAGGDALRGGGAGLGSTPDRGILLPGTPIVFVAQGDFRKVRHAKAHFHPEAAAVKCVSLAGEKEPIGEHRVRQAARGGQVAAVAGCEKQTDTLHSRSACHFTSGSLNADC